jgi:hypothetical protein
LLIIIDIRSHWNVTSSKRSIANDSDAWNCKLSGGLYMESLGRSFSSSLIVSKRGLIIIGLSVVF